MSSFEQKGDRAQEVMAVALYAFVRAKEYDDALLEWADRSNSMKSFYRRGAESLRVALARNDLVVPR